MLQNPPLVNITSVLPINNFRVPVNVLRMVTILVSRREESILIDDVCVGGAAACCHSCAWEWFSVAENFNTNIHFFFFFV